MILGCQRAHEEGVASVCDMYVIPWTTIQCPKLTSISAFLGERKSTVLIHRNGLCLAPLYIKGTGNKVWMALFTCCAMRCIHLELVPDMTTETFIRCFIRFTSRRGTPTRIVSDNSKTFKAASKELLIQSLRTISRGLLVL